MFIRSVHIRLLPCGSSMGGFMAETEVAKDHNVFVRGAYIKTERAFTPTPIFISTASTPAGNDVEVVCSLERIAPGCSRVNGFQDFRIRVPASRKVGGADVILRHVHIHDLVCADINVADFGNPLG